MIVRLKKDDLSFEEFRQKLLAWFACTRFVINDIYGRPGRGAFKGCCIHLLSVRLKRRAFYYGFGPYERDRAMERNGWGRGNSHPGRVGFLGGRDWIEFNDLLNDFMDENNIVADIATTHCVIRRDDKRRISYNASPVGSKSMWPTGVYSWDRVPLDNKDFVVGADCPLLPFSSCNAEPAGDYRMLGINNFNLP